jgi:hypothetical protein
VVGHGWLQPMGNNQAAREMSAAAIAARMP